MFELIPWRRRKSSLELPRTFEWMDRFFEEMEPFLWEGGKELVPAFDVSETETKIVVKADLPGIDVKELDISMSGNVLTVKGERKREHEEKGENYHRVERRYGSFSRSISLPADVKAEDIEATYKDGVLLLSIPKSEAAQRKRIEVKTT